MPRRPRHGPADAAVRIRGVELLQVELGFAVQGHARPGSQPRQRCGVVDEILAQPSIGPCVPSRRIPGPEPDEVVPIASQEVQVGLEIKRLRRVAAAHVDQSVPRVGTCQHHLPAARIAEVPRVPGGHPQGPLAGCGGAVRCWAKIREPNKPDDAPSANAVAWPEWARN